MYYNNKKPVLSIAYIVVGIALIVLCSAGVIGNSVFSGLGGGLCGVGALQIARNIRYQKNEDYKEKIDIELTDERNRYLRMKAWSWAGYLFVIGGAVVSLIFLFGGLEIYGRIISFCMCFVLAAYWISYMLLKKKY